MVEHVICASPNIHNNFFSIGSDGSSGSFIMSLLLSPDVLGKRDVLCVSK